VTQTIPKFVFFKRWPISANQGFPDSVAVESQGAAAWITSEMDRIGHTTSAVLNRYRRAARSAAELKLEALLPLDEAIPELKWAKRWGDRAVPLLGRDHPLSEKHL